MKKVDLAIIGAGPSGAATAIRAANQGVETVVFDRAPYGRDKACGDGLTPRAVGVLQELGIDLADAHLIEGLRMIAGSTERVLPWPETSRFPAHGAVWPRRALDGEGGDLGGLAASRRRLRTPRPLPRPPSTVPAPSSWGGS